MANYIVTILLFACIVITVDLLVSTVIRCKSEKKNFFIFCMVGILLYVGGYFFEVTSTDVSGAFTGVKLMYAGACFMSPLFLMFILDYCEVSIRVPLRVLMVAVPFVNVVLVWTTDRTGLIYAAFRYTEETMLHGLQIVAQGPLYYLVYIVSAVCIAISFLVIIQRNFIWGSRYRKPLFLLMLISAGPLLANVIYILSTYIFKTDLHGINLTPYVLVSTSTIFYHAVLRYDLFDFSTRAQSVAVDIAHDAVIFVDMKNNFSSANATARELIPSLADFPKGKPLSGAPGWPEELNILPPKGGTSETDLSIERDGEMRYYRARAKPIEANGHNIGTVFLVQDTTDTVTLMKELEEAAFIDALTGLYNRRHFMEVVTILLERAKREGKQCSMLMLDLDMFKGINDTYGHLAGDEVLRAVGRSIKDVIRSYDVVGRYGGEEFVIFMEGASLDAAAGRAEFIRKHIESLTIRYADTDMHITCSIGVAESPDSSESITHLLERADVALYCAKREGRNLVRTARP